jgi:hypothetical protein
MVGPPSSWSRAEIPARELLEVAMFESAKESKSKNWVIIWAVTGVLVAVMVAFALVS